MQRIILTCCLLCLLSCSLLKAQNQKALIIDDEKLKYQDIHQFLSFYKDDSQKLTIEDFLGPDSAGFTNNEDFLQQATSPAVIWLKLKVINMTKEERSLILRSTDCASTITLYEVADGNIKGVHNNGHTVPPLQKEVPSSYPVIPISAGANVTTDFYLRIHFPREVSWSDCYSFRLEERKADISEIINKSAGQTFYAGLMLMFSLLSFFTFILFRDKDFIYFGFVHIAFAFYFFVNKGAFLMLVYNVPFIFGFRIQYISVSILILSLSVFLSRYLKLQQKNKKYYYLFCLVSLIAVISYYPIYFFLKKVFIAARVSNIFYIIWIIVALIPIISQARDRDKSAINLLAAISLLVLASIIYLLATFRILPKNFFTTNSFQISTILFSLLVFYRLFEIVREISAEKYQAISLNDLKSKFFTNISHEFRTPLTLIMGPLKQLIDNSSNVKDVKLLEVALKNSNRLLNMVNQLLDLSKIESNHLKLNIEKNEFISFVKGVFMSFESLAGSKQMKMQFDSNFQNIDLWYDVEKMEIILFNLLSNAFKFTPEKGVISMKIIDNDDTIKIIISDSGKGILTENLPYVFDRFFRVENSQDNAIEGSGIGLSLTKELVELHQGKIFVESEIGEGTTFILEFKKGNEHFNQESLSSDSSSQISSTFDIDLLKENSIELDVIPSKTLTPQHKKSTILLVEDNEDVRQYLKSILIDQFDILEAENGQLGFEMATDHMPELVISDVMMPVMDGFEFCAKIKQDVRTSHIPVILLTAKAENENKLTGLELGADDYLLKPFHAKELNIRVRKLIELRVELRKRLLESPLIKIQQPDGNPVENRFIEQISGIINDQMDNPNLSVDLLAEKVGLSRSQLNRKIKSISEMTTNKYIQYIRLQKALVLLETEDKNVSEVTYLVGFSSVAYFVKCFKDQFGKTPGSFQK